MHELLRGDVRHTYSIRGVFAVNFLDAAFGFGTCRIYLLFAVFSGTLQVGALRRPGPQQFSAEPESLAAALGVLQVGGVVLPPLR